MTYTKAYKTFRGDLLGKGDWRNFIKKDKLLKAIGAGAVGKAADR